MSERKRDRVLSPSEEYGDCSRETKEQWLENQRKLKCKVERQIEEQRMEEQVKKYVNDAAEEVKGWEHDDFAEGRKSMRLLLFCLKKSDIACVQEVYAIDLIKLCIFEYVMANCLSYEEIEFRLEDFTFSNDMLFGVKLGRRIAEVYDILEKTVKEGVRYTPTGVLLHPNKEMVPIVRLLENTRRQDKLSMWRCDHLWALAMRLSTRVFLIDEIERVDITKEEVFVRFDSELIRSMPHGGRLWPISPKSLAANRKLFIAMMDTPGMKKKFPRAAYAIRILEVASERGWFEELNWKTFMKEYERALERKRKADEGGEESD
jgi:hypothetical protein